ncbi:MAG: hypothetical protein ACE5OZ_17710 [Candidatus Heimdallarchaeota archaeon]
MQDSRQESFSILQSFLDRNQGLVEITVLGGDAPLPDNISFTTHNLRLKTKISDGFLTEGFLTLVGDDGSVSIRLHARNVIVRENLPYWPRGILIGNDDDGLIVLIKNNMD